MIHHILQALKNSQDSLSLLLENQKTIEEISKAAEALTECLSSGGRAFSCGNGGSMSDAMHFAEELTGRFRETRKALAATAISDPGHITCTAGFCEGFRVQRQTGAGLCGSPGGRRNRRLDIWYPGRGVAGAADFCFSEAARGQLSPAV